MRFVLFIAVCFLLGADGYSQLIGEQIWKHHNTIDIDGIYKAKKKIAKDFHVNIDSIRIERLMFVSKRSRRSTYDALGMIDTNTMMRSSGSGYNTFTTRQILYSTTRYWSFRFSVGPVIYEGKYSERKFKGKPYNVHSYNEKYRHERKWAYNDERRKWFN